MASKSSVLYFSHWNCWLSTRLLLLSNSVLHLRSGGDNFVPNRSDCYLPYQIYIKAEYLEACIEYRCTPFSQRLILKFCSLQRCSWWQVKSKNNTSSITNIFSSKIVKKSSYAKHNPPGVKYQTTLSPDSWWGSADCKNLPSTDAWKSWLELVNCKVYTATWYLESLLRGKGIELLTSRHLTLAGKV